MKQKVVLNVSLHYKNKFLCFNFGELTSHSKALQIAAGSRGVQSAGWKAGDKTKLEVSGEDIDLILLTKKLNKKIGHTTILLVEEKKEEKEEKKEVPIPFGFPHYQYFEMPYSNPPYSNPGPCCIM